MTQKMSGATCMLLAITGLLFGMAQAGADQPAYKCGHKGGVSYTQVPCPGGKLVGATPVRQTDRSKVPPQDRAVLAKRAVLSPQDREECQALDVRLRHEAAAVKAKGGAATLQDEMPLVQSRKQFRELRC
jgi:hypothetical protein